MSIKIKALKGVNDILPNEIEKWNFVEQQARWLCFRYGYKEIRLPILEESALFTRSIGQTTDIVEKEMYTFLDKGLRKIALRPEATASAVRAYLEHNFDQSGLTKLFYAGPMFRGEKPQQGRNRQFYQIGIEAFGSYSPYLDAEVIDLAVAYLRLFNIKNFSIILNSAGCNKDKENFAKQLNLYLTDKKDRLCECCQNRYQKNILRILDCKNKLCRKTINNAPKIVENLCANCQDRFQQVRKNLDLLNIQYTLDPYLVRGLDYYTGTIFEIRHGQLGAQNTVSAGGRYDNLVADLGGKDTGAIGFAFGVERLLIAAEAEKFKFPQQEQTMVYIIGLGDSSYAKAFAITNILRTERIAAFIDVEQRSLKAQMRHADKLNCRYVLIIGDDELKQDCVILRDMLNSSQELIKISKLIDEIKKKLNI